MKKAYINGLEVPFKDLGEPQITFEGETYEVVTDQNGEPYFMYNGMAVYVEFRDEDGEVISFSEPEEEVDDPEEEATAPVEPSAEEAPVTPAPTVKTATPEKLNPFELTIQSYLQKRGDEDELVAEILRKPHKNIKDCCNYIIKTVQATGRQGFADEEIYGMAIHYYQEDSVEAGKQVNAKVVVNHTVELSQEDKDRAHKLAVERAIQQEQERMKAKKKAPAKPTTNQPQVQQSLF